MIIQPQLRNDNTTGGRRWTSFNVSSFKTIVLMFRERKQLLCEFWIQSFLKMWRSVRKYLRLQRLNIKCNGFKCFAVLSSSSVPFVNCVGQLFVGVLTIKSYNKLNKCQSHLLFSSSRMKWKSLNQHKHHISVANMNLFEISGHSRNNAACNLLNVKCKVPSCVQNFLTSSRINAATRSHF